MQEEVLRFRNVYLKNTSSGPINFSLLRGEILGFYGVNTMEDELLPQVIVGTTNPAKGRIFRFAAKDKKNCSHSLIASSFRHDAVSIGARSLLINDLTVGENLLALALPNAHGCLAGSKKTRQVIHCQLLEYGISLDLNQPIYRLGRYNRLLLEIYIAVNSGASVVLVNDQAFDYTWDELTSLRSIIQRLAKQGVSFIFLGHNIYNLCMFCHRILFFQNGAVNISLSNTVENRTNILSFASQMKNSLTQTGKNQAPLDTPPVLKLQIDDALTGIQCSLSLVAGRITTLCDVNRTTIRVLLQNIHTPTANTAFVFEGQVLRDLTAQRRDNRIHLLDQGFLPFGLLPDAQTLRSSDFDSAFCFAAGKKIYSHGVMNPAISRYLKREYAKWCEQREKPANILSEEIDISEALALSLYRCFIEKPKVIILKQYKGLSLDNLSFLEDTISFLAREQNTAVLYLAVDPIQLRDFADEYYIVRDNTLKWLPYKEFQESFLQDYEKRMDYNEEE